MAKTISVCDREADIFEYVKYKLDHNQRFQTIAKLGGWCNSKRTGIPGWQVIWEGWAKLQDRVLTYRLTRAIEM